MGILTLHFVPALADLLRTVAVMLRMVAVMPFGGGHAFRGFR